MPIVKISLAENTVTQEQKDKVEAGVRKLLIGIMHKDPKRIYLSFEEAPRAELEARIQENDTK
ncbi:hypothetical protein FAI40_02905 [Acetobacteraceae bacterium]|nr:hypothetical protein FAI40_02905 [Acetobacteraceae bacterium]